MKLLNNKNKHPHIIMISSASSPKDRKYYIDMKKHILSVSWRPPNNELYPTNSKQCLFSYKVPANYEFMDVVDLFLSYTRHSIWLFMPTSKCCSPFFKNISTTLSTTQIPCRKPFKALQIKYSTFDPSLTQSQRTAQFKSTPLFNAHRS